MQSKKCTKSPSMGPKKGNVPSLHLSLSQSTVILYHTRPNVGLVFNEMLCPSLQKSSVNPPNTHSVRILRGRHVSPQFAVRDSKPHAMHCGRLRISNERQLMHQLHGLPTKDSLLKENQETFERFQKFRIHIHHSPSVIKRVCLTMGYPLVNKHSYGKRPFI